MLSFLRRLFGQTQPPAGYGLSPQNPVLCGGGPPGERDYLERLRCPSGKPVSYRRHGSTSTTETEFLNKPGIRFDPGPKPPIPEEMKEFLDADFPTEEMLREEVGLDIYEIKCSCGAHQFSAVFMDMYHRGPSVPIGKDGWRLAEG